MTIDRAPDSAEGRERSPPPDSGGPRSLLPYPSAGVRVGIISPVAFSRCSADEPLFTDRPTAALAPQPRGQGPRDGELGGIRRGDRARGINI